MTKHEFLAISLPYGLKLKIFNHEEFKQLSGYDFIEGDETGDLFPILYPLSSITKQIEHNGERFVPYKKLFDIGKKIGYSESFLTHCLDRFSRIMDKNYLIDVTPYFIIQKLIEWHFDVAGLIDEKEAVDVNTLDANPYK